MLHCASRFLICFPGYVTPEIVETVGLCYKDLVSIHTTQDRETHPGWWATHKSFIYSCSNTGHTGAQTCNGRWGNHNKSGKRSYALVPHRVVSGELQHHGLNVKHTMIFTFSSLSLPSFAQGMGHIMGCKGIEFQDLMKLTIGTKGGEIQGSMGFGEG